LHTSKSTPASPSCDEERGNQAYNYNDKYEAATKIMQVTQIFSYYFMKHQKSIWSKEHACKKMSEMTNIICQVVLFQCKLTNMHDLLKARITGTKTRDKLRKEKNAHIRENPRMTEILKETVIHPVTYNLTKTAYPQVRKILTACGVDMNKRFVTIDYIAEKVQMSMTRHVTRRNYTFEQGEKNPRKVPIL
jgi:hypothetical protein